VVTTAGPVAGPVFGMGSPVLPQPTGSPTVLRVLLGAYMRRLRESRRISIDEASRVIRSSNSKLTKLEAGRAEFTDLDLAELLTFYGVTAEGDRLALRAVAIRASSPGWWRDYADVLPGWFDEYVGLEEAASEIRGYEVQFVPGLLQTEDYARAVIMLSYSHPKGISRRVKLRMARQAILDRPEPPALRMVLDEALLSRPIGGAKAMRAQIKHLIEMSQRPNVTLQVVPFNAGGHPAAGGSFSLLSFDDQNLPDVVYLEQLTGAQYHTKADIVDGYVGVMQRLSAEAPTPAGSLKLLRSMLRES
jgi:transcriptional regulator with XRE-family HTH domain